MENKVGAFKWEIAVITNVHFLHSTKKMCWENWIYCSTFYKKNLTDITSNYLCQRQPPVVFYRKGGLKNFSKFTGKNVSQSQFIKKKLWHRCFSVNSEKLLRTTFLQDCFCYARGKEANLSSKAPYKLYIL